VDLVLNGTEVPVLASLIEKDYDQGMNGKLTVVEAVETTGAKRAVLLKADLIEQVSGVVEVPTKEAAIIVELIFDKMVRSLLSPLDRHALKRFDVAFVTKKRNLDALIGRTAHIYFLDQSNYMLMLLHVYHEYFK